MTSSPAEQESTGTRRGKTVALKDGSVHLLVGSASFRVEKGVLSSAGARLPAQTSVRVPFGRALPLEAEEPSEIVLFDGSETRLRDVGRRTVPEAWTAAADALVKDAPRLLLCLGFSYTGKNFFCTHLANRFRAAGKRVCVIDADPDQTEIGPPGCVGLLDMNDPVLFFSQALPTALQYVGSHSVIARPAVVLAAAQRLVNKALHERRAEVVLVNVPGWTAEDSGRCFHALLSTLLSPDRTIVLQRKDESEHLVRGVPVSRTVRLRASEFAARSSADERKRYREERTTAYYQNRRLLVLPFHHVSSAGASFLSGYPQKIVNEKILYVERMPSELEGVLVAVPEPLSPVEADKIKRTYERPALKQIVAGSEAGVQVGLADENGDTLALGVIQKFDFSERHIEIWTPLALGREDKVKILQFGTLRLTLDGREDGSVDAGKF